MGIKCSLDFEENEGGSVFIGNDCVKDRNQL